MGDKELERKQVKAEKYASQVESMGLIKRLSFGNLVLLQPELLDWVWKPPI